MTNSSKKKKTSLFLKKCILSHILTTSLKQWRYHFVNFLVL